METNTFVENNLEKPYFELAEDMMLLKPICGLLKKWSAQNDKPIEHDPEIEKRDKEITELRREVLRLNKEIDSILTRIHKNTDDERTLMSVRGKAVDKTDIDLLYIKCIIGDYFNANIDLDCRERKIVYARQMAMYYARKLTDASLAAIGVIMGGREHATVYHSCNLIESLSAYGATRKHLDHFDKVFGFNGYGKLDDNTIKNNSK